MNTMTLIGFASLAGIVFLALIFRDWLKARALGQLCDFFQAKKRQQDVEVDFNHDDRKKVCYHSEKRGWRNGRRVVIDDSGKIIIEMIARDGSTYTVKRQTHLVYEGWRFKAIKDPMSPREYAVLQKRIAMATGYGAVGLPETFEEFNIAPL